MGSSKEVRAAVATEEMSGDVGTEAVPGDGLPEVSEPLLPPETTTITITTTTTAATPATDASARRVTGA
jgi:hypothetical protein